MQTRLENIFKITYIYIRYIVCSKCVFQKRFSSCFFKYLHMTFSVFIKDVTSFPRILLALQNTRFPLSSLTTVLCTEEVIFTKSPLLANVELDRLEMSTADLYHVMLADGIQYDVIHVRVICCPITTVIGVVITDMLTFCTGTIRKNLLFTIPSKKTKMIYKYTVNRCKQ